MYTYIYIYIYIYTTPPVGEAPALPPRPSLALLAPRPLHPAGGQHLAIRTGCAEPKLPTRSSYLLTLGKLLYIGESCSNAGVGEQSSPEVLNPPCRHGMLPASRLLAAPRARHSRWGAQQGRPGAPRPLAVGRG